MLNILTGIIAGVVSGLGMGGGTVLILILTVFTRNRATCCTSHKPNFFYSNIYSSNNSKFKKQNNRQKIGFNNFNFWYYWSNHRSNYCK